GAGIQPARLFHVQPEPVRARSGAEEGPPGAQASLPSGTLGLKTTEPAAIIDIGSNSVRLVVYAGPPRVPTPIFNEKVLAGLGSGKEGELPPEARATTLAALNRFKLLIDHMKVKRTQVVATAAIRDAGAEGEKFVRDVGRIGFDCEVLSAQEEAALAGEGVLSGIPEADGIVGDLGGGSLELVEVG